MRFREHRGPLTDAMATVVELPDRDALIAHCRALLNASGFEFADEALKIASYASDPRIGWDPQSLVTIQGYGVMGNQLSTNGYADNRSG